jgi:general stress protein YciG
MQPIGNLTVNNDKSKRQQIALSDRTSRLTIEEKTMADIEKIQKTGKKRGPVAGTEEARRGGEAVRKKYGRDFYSRIGKKGGDTVRREHGSEFYAEIGRKGGEQTKNRQGSEFYARIGRIGGQRNRARVQPDTDKK